MPKLNELKKKYPELNITFFDIMLMIDPSKTNKYLPLLCKVFSERWDLKKQYGNEDSFALSDIKNKILEYGLSIPNVSNSELMVISYFMDFYRTNIFPTLNDFIFYNERNQIMNNDVLSYKTFDEVRDAVNLADIQTIDKEYEKQIIKEFEDENWIIVRPLSFQSSLKYGSNTRWCTTMKNEKNYFSKYWRKGILIYVINKKTGYKFAGFKNTTDDNELSFWNSSDNRVDFLELEIDDYMYKILKKILQSEKSNKDLCTIELQVAVELECGYSKMNNLNRFLGGEPLEELYREEDNPTTMAAPLYVTPTVA